MKIIIFDKGGRTKRVLDQKKGLAPRDFLYGTDKLEQTGNIIDRQNVRSSYTGARGRIVQGLESIISRFTGMGMRPHLAKQFKRKLQANEVAISFTDGFSLTLGDVYRKDYTLKSRLVGCFHRLCDIEDAVPKYLKNHLRRKITLALERLDHVAFFGPEDRNEAIKRYGLSKNKSSNFTLGIDSDFWAPTSEPEEDYYFSIGQDPQRDFDLLVNLDIEQIIHIQTALEISVPPEKSNIILNAGNYYESRLSDVQLRSLYCRSKAILLPLRDVFQPSGYSVMLQAMSCAKPVIITLNRGFWDREFMRDGVNCIFVKPGQKEGWKNAINYLNLNPTIRRQMGISARQTILEHYPLTKSVQSIKRTMNLIN